MILLQKHTFFELIWLNLNYLNLEWVTLILFLEIEVNFPRQFKPVLLGKARHHQIILPVSSPFILLSSLSHPPIDSRWKSTKTIMRLIGNRHKPRCVQFDYARARLLGNPLNQSIPARPGHHHHRRAVLRIRCWASFENELALSKSFVSLKRWMARIASGWMDGGLWLKTWLCLNTIATLLPESVQVFFLQAAAAAVADSPWSPKQQQHPRRWRLRGFSSSSSFFLRPGRKLSSFFSSLWANYDKLSNLSVNDYDNDDDDLLVNNNQIKPRKLFRRETEQARARVNTISQVNWPFFNNDNNSPETDDCSDKQTNKVERRWAWTRWIRLFIWPGLDWTWSWRWLKALNTGLMHALACRLIRARFLNSSKKWREKALNSIVVAGGRSVHCGQIQFVPFGNLDWQGGGGGGVV